VPAVYETISMQVKVADGRVERRAVLCESNATPTKIRELQTALKTAGFDPGAIDGRIKATMMSAVAAYQTSKRLPVDDGRVINIDTVKALGVAPY
jgi:peptidoglycan hydrolase-like protein with peptidoglycan-binding domain